MLCSSLVASTCFSSATEQCVRMDERREVWLTHTQNCCSMRPGTSPMTSDTTYITSASATKLAAEREKKKVNLKRIWAMNTVEAATAGTITMSTLTCASCAIVPTIRNQHNKTLVLLTFYCLSNLTNASLNWSVARCIIYCKNETECYHGNWNIHKWFEIKLHSCIYI